jgi:hypothetical protein
VRPYLEKKKSQKKGLVEWLMALSSNPRNEKTITLRFYLTPVRVAIINNKNNNKCWPVHGMEEG